MRMDIETQPSSDHHNNLHLHLHHQQQSRSQQEETNVEYQLAESSNRFASQPQSIRPQIASQVHYFYHTAADTSFQQPTVCQSNESQSQSQPQSQFQAAQSQVATQAHQIQVETSDQIRESRIVVANEHPEESQRWCSSRTANNCQSTLEYLSGYSDFATPHQISSRNPTTTQQPPAASYYNEDPNSFYPTSHHQQTSDYNYALYQRNAWNFAPTNEETQFGQQHYNYGYNYTEPGQQQHQIDNLLQQENKQTVGYYHQANQLIPEHHDTTSFLYSSDRYSSSAQINSYEQAEQLAQQQQQNSLTNNRLVYFEGSSEVANGVKASSVWTAQANSPSGTTDELLTNTCDSPNNQACRSTQENFWLSSSGGQQEQRSQLLLKKVGKSTNRTANSSSSSVIQRNNQCSVCGRNYARPSTLKTHLRTHTNERPFKCNVCFKTFSQAANLTAHQRVHTGERPFSCPICGRQFSQSSSVITHLRTHSGERPYRCRMCSRTFSDSSTLTKHCRIHSGEKPYQCDFCPLNFSQSGNLSRHLKLHLMNGSGSTSSTTSSTSNASSSNQSTTSSTHHVYDSFCNTPIDNIKEKQDKTIIDVSSTKFNQIVEAPELKQMITKHDAIRFS